jgi:tetratricopeptide (TPR) repeat protein
MSLIQNTFGIHHVNEIINIGAAFFLRAENEEDPKNPNNTEKLIIDYQNSSKLGYKIPSCHLKIGILQYSKMQYTLALENLNRAEELSSDQDANFKLKLYLHRARLYGSIGNYKLAANDYTKALTLGNTDNYYDEIGLFYLKKATVISSTPTENLQIAVNCFKRALNAPGQKHNKGYFLDLLRKAEDQLNIKPTLSDLRNEFKMREDDLLEFKRNFYDKLPRTINDQIGFHKRTTKIDSLKKQIELAENEIKDQRIQDSVNEQKKASEEMMKKISDESSLNSSLSSSSSLISSSSSSVLASLSLTDQQPSSASSQQNSGNQSVVVDNSPPFSSSFTALLASAARRTRGALSSLATSSSNHNTNNNSEPGASNGPAI